MIDWIHSNYIQKEEWISPKPKRFAKFCGLTLLSLSLVFYFYNVLIYLFFLSILTLFSFLEFAFDFCIACKIYGILQKIGVISQDHCENC